MTHLLATLTPSTPASSVSPEMMALIQKATADWLAMKRECALQKHKQGQKARRRDGYCTACDTWL